MGVFGKNKSDPSAILDRFQDPSEEPEVVAAAEARGRADTRAEALASELSSIATRIDDAEREMATQVLDGLDVTAGGEDLPSLRRARREKRDEYDLAEKVAEIARERLQLARSTAKERLQGEYEAAHRKLVATVSKELNEAMAVNTALRDLEDRARSVIGQGAAVAFLPRTRSRDPDLPLAIR